MTIEETKEVMERYFGSWPNSDFAAFRECLADEIEFDGGDMSYKGDADSFVAMTESGTLWRDVTLRDAVYGEGKAALIYDAIDTGTGLRMRVGEIATIENGKIVKMTASITTVEEP